LWRYRARTVQNDRRASDVNDGGFEADGGWSGVKDGVDAAAEVGEDVFGGGGAGVAEAIGAGSGDGKRGGAEEIERRGVRGHTDADERTAGGNSVRDSGQFRQEHGERTRPEACGEALDTAAEWAVEDSDAIEFVQIGEMHDKWVPGRALLGREDSRDGLGRERVGAEAVDRFGGERDQAAGSQKFGGASDVCRVVGT
jgi:hypothetical protein